MDHNPTRLGKADLHLVGRQQEGEQEEGDHLLAPVEGEHLAVEGELLADLYSNPRGNKEYSVGNNLLSISNAIAFHSLISETCLFLPFSVCDKVALSKMVLVSS